MAVDPTTKAEILRLWVGDLSLSAAKIGARMGVTTNTVIGLAHRAGLSRQDPRGETARKMREARRAKNPPKRAIPSRETGTGRWPKPEAHVAQPTLPRLEGGMERIEDPRQIELPLDPPAPSPDGSGAGAPELIQFPTPAKPAASAEGAPGVTILQLTHGMCRSVALDPDWPGGLYCGAASTDGPYCPYHRQLYYEPKKPRSRERVHPVRRAA